MFNINDSIFSPQDASTTDITANNRRPKLRTAVPEAVQKVHEVQRQAERIEKLKDLKPEEIRVLKVQEKVRREFRDGLDQYDFMVNMFKEKEMERTKKSAETHGNIFGKLHKDPYLVKKKKVELQFESENPRAKNKRMFVSENVIRRLLKNKGANVGGFGILSGQIYRKDSSNGNVYYVKCSPADERRKFLALRFGLPLHDEMEKVESSQKVLWKGYNKNLLVPQNSQEKLPIGIVHSANHNELKKGEELITLESLFERPLGMQESDFDMETMGIWRSMSTQFKENYMNSRNSSTSLEKNKKEYFEYQKESENEKEQKLMTQWWPQRPMMKTKPKLKVVVKPKTRTKFVREEKKDIFELIWEIFEEDERKKKLELEKNREDREREEKLKKLSLKSKRFVDIDLNGPSFEAIEEFNQNLRKLKNKPETRHEDEYYILYKTQAFHQMLDASSKKRENPFTTGIKKMERELEKSSPFKTEWMKTFRENYRRAKKLTSADLSISVRKPRPRTFFRVKPGLKVSSLEQWAKSPTSKFLPPDQKIPLWQKRTNFHF